MMPKCSVSFRLLILCFRNAFELQALQDGMAELKQSLSSENIGKFEDCVEVHMQHIMSGLSRSDLRRNYPLLRSFVS